MDFIRQTAVLDEQTGIGNCLEMNKLRKMTNAQTIKRAIKPAL